MTAALRREWAAAVADAVAAEGLAVAALEDGAAAALPGKPMRPQPQMEPHRPQRQLRLVVAADAVRADSAEANSIRLK